MMNVGKMGIAAAFFAASALLVTGCGGKTADRAPEPGAWQATGDPQDVITAANFDALQEGTFLWEVQAIYGKGEKIHQSIVDGIYTSTYRFQDGPKIVEATFTHENWTNNPLSFPALTSKEFIEIEQVGMLRPAK